MNRHALRRALYSLHLPAFAGVVLGLVTLAAPTLSAAPASAAGPAKALAARPAPAARRTSEAVAESLFTALRRRDYDGAFALFDERMKDAVPLEKLKTVWEDQLSRLGAFVSWTQEAGDPVQGQDVRLAALQLEHGQLKGMVTIDPATAKVSGFFIRPVASPPASAAAYVDTTKFHVVETHVGSDAMPLGATLTLPVGKGPFPAAILVHGSGPQDRDETIGGSKVFRDIAEGLSSRGVAVLRYDKRTLRYPEKMKDKPTIDDEVILDAVSAVAALRARPDIDTKRVVVIGHSLGALLAPEIGVRAAPVAGVVLLAPPGRKPWDIVIGQMRYLGMPDSQIAGMERSVADIKAGKDETLLGAPGSYWRDWAARDGFAMARKLGKPILILRGERDYQVEDVDVEAWRKALGGAPNVEIVTLPALNHLFIAGTGKPGPSEYETPGHVDRVVIDKVAAFVSAPGR
ncbi:MAG: alpha/beta fold hydrolase [Bacteroidota bacterium]